MDSTKQWFNYLHTERNLSVKVIGDACLKISDNKLEIPIFDKDGIHLFSKYRKEPWSDNNAPKYTYEVGSHVSLYGQHFTKQHETLILTEGEIDCMALRTIGYDAYSSTGGAMSWQRDWTLDYIGRVPTILFDNDEAGINGAVKTILILGEAIYSWIPPAYGKDISDVLSNKGIEFCQKMLEDPIRKIHININKLTTKKSIITKKKEFQEISKSLDYNSVGQKFMSALIKKMQELEKSYSPKKQTYIPTGNNDKERAKSYPIRNLINVGEHGENKNKAHCPFHKNGAERTPSLHIYPDNSCFCHGCGKYADAIDVYMAINNLHGPGGFKDAISQLINKI